MEGVQFLLSEPVYENGMKFIPCLLCCLVLVGLMCTAVFCSSISIVKKKYWLIIPAIVSLIAYIIGFTHTREAIGPKFSHNEYQVVVHDGVDFNEFMELYTIEDVDGKIYTITINAETALEERELAVPIEEVK